MAGNKVVGAKFWDEVEAFYEFPKKIAPPGNRTRVARMGILHDTTTPAVLVACVKEDSIESSAKLLGCSNDR